MVLYRILTADVINVYIYGFLVVYFLWIARRIINGVSVVFDISASRAYLYSFIASLIVFGSLALYFQIYHSTIYYLINVFNQAN
ncbi:MAG: hypothetical protein PF445_09305 [Melioribacteraceae bacterium]|jgi:hypothetical protein|nr:hypothetical protein [Melioribacteraceae bacterium]